MKVAAIKGFADILPGETETWQFVEDKARAVFELYNFSEIRIPIVEKTELFSRSLGETTDIVEKEMYTFADHDAQESLLTLRPEGTAGVIRAYVEAGLDQVDPVQKLFYTGPMFRRERPQKGRLRQFYQIGAEVLGRKDPAADAELLLLLHDFFSLAGVDGIELELNSLGCVECRPGYRQALLAFLEARVAALCGNCRRRLERNPLRVLDCKEKGCIEATAGAPSILDFLCAACREHFGTVQRLLRESRVGYKLTPRMVRGLDYYCRTTFEWTTDRLGAQNTVAAGGRYDGLVEELGGAPTPGVGFALGVERLVLLLQARELRQGRGPSLYVAWIGSAGHEWAFPVVHRLRQRGIIVEIDGEARTLKSQMRRADKLGADYVLIVGEDELKTRKAILRNMKTKEQAEVELDRLDAELPRFLERA